MNKLLQEIAIIKLTALANGKWFDISLLKDLLQMIGGQLTDTEYTTLRHVHCVHYSMLTPESRVELGTYIQEILLRYIKDVPMPDFEQKQLLEAM